MDWVQIYVIGLLTLNALAAFYLMGKGGVRRDDGPLAIFIGFIFNILILLPTIGRVFGWW